MASITTQSGYVYPITNTDLLWLARMVSPGAEGGNNVASLWTIASHHAMVRGTSLTDTARNYSQPISPLWARGGTKCGPGGSAVGQPSCSEAKLANRDRIAALQPADMPGAWDLVQRWAAGQIPNPVPRATEWADPTVSASCLAGSHGDCARLVLADGNWYMSSHTSDTWPANFVRVSGAGDAQSSGGIGTAVFGGLLAYGAWRLWRSR